MFEMNDRVRRSRSIFASLAATVLLTGCAHQHFNNAGLDPSLLQFGQGFAHERCKKRGDYRAHQECIRRVDKNYSELTK